MNGIKKSIKAKHIVSLLTALIMIITLSSCGRLNELIRSYDGDNDSLAVGLQEKMNEAYYWGDKKFSEVLNGNMYQNNMINYLLWDYEQHLQRKGYVLSGSVGIESESVEHIAPQTEPDEVVESGYEIEATGLYSKDFRDNYVNKLGNLMLISQSHNSAIGNKPFADKLQSYKDNPLLRQQAQIKEFVKDESNPVWDSKAIDSRHQKMVEYALDRWGFSVQK